MAIRRSFHDPEGFVAEAGEKILRWVAAPADRRIKEMLQSSWGAMLVREGLLIRTTVADPASCGSPRQDDTVGQGTWYSHPRITFPSYPHEWVPEMLCSAARLTLDLNDRLIAHRHILKDASARNVLFTGTRPIFVDVLSIQPRIEGNPLWRARGQFERHFLLPLLAYRYLGIPPSRIHSAYDDGLTHESLHRALGAAKWFSPRLLWFATLPNLLARARSPRRAESGPPIMAADIAESTLRFGLRGLRRGLNAISASLAPPSSLWAAYEEQVAHYPDHSLQRKRETVEHWLNDIRHRTVLDLGANTGTFSKVAARGGAAVVAVESDVDACRLLFESAHAEGLCILPLTMSISNPSAPRGWSGLEAKGFDERAAKQFDLVLALAILHHLMISEGIPLPEIISKLASYSSRYLILEFVSAADPKFLELQRSRQLEFGDFSEEAFRQELARHFRILAREEIVPACRSLYLCETC